MLKDAAVLSTQNSKAVACEISLEMDFSDVGTAGTSKRTAFETQMAADLSRAMKIPSSSIQVTGLEPGSVQVEFQIRPLTGMTETPAAIRNRLLEQVRCKTSPLYDGFLTKQINVGKSIKALTERIVVDTDKEMQRKLRADAQRTTSKAQEQRLRAMSMVYGEIKHGNTRSMAKAVSAWRRSAGVSAATRLHRTAHHSKKETKWKNIFVFRFLQGTMKAGVMLLRVKCVTDWHRNMMLSKAHHKAAQEASMLTQEIRAYHVHAAQQPKSDDIVRIMIEQHKCAAAMKRMMEVRAMNMSRLTVQSVSLWRINCLLYEAEIQQGMLASQKEELETDLEDEIGELDNDLNKAREELKTLRSQKEKTERQLKEEAFENEQRWKEDTKLMQQKMKDVEIQFEKKIKLLETNKFDEEKTQLNTKNEMEERMSSLKEKNQDLELKHTKLQGMIKDYKIELNANKETVTKLTGSREEIESQVRLEYDAKLNNQKELASNAQDAKLEAQADRDDEKFKKKEALATIKRIEDLVKKASEGKIDGDVQSFAKDIAKAISN